MVMEEKCCRLCLGDEGDGSLVQPCACRGTAMWIHGHCLEYWRRTSPKEDAAYRCGLCTDRYRDLLSLELLRARLQAKRTDGEDTSFTLGTLASELHAQRKHDEAEPLYRELLEVNRETLGNRHPTTLTTIRNLGLLLKHKGDLAAAEPLFREAVEGQRETLGDQHPDTLLSINHLGLLFKKKGDLAAAEPLYREVLEAQRETLGSRHPTTLNSIHNLGSLLLGRRGRPGEVDLAVHAKYDEAELLCIEALVGRRETLGNQHPSTLSSDRLHFRCLFLGLIELREEEAVVKLQTYVRAVFKFKKCIPS